MFRTVLHLSPSSNRYCLSRSRDVSWISRRVEKYSVWAIVNVGPWTGVYPRTRLKFISWFVDAPSGDVGGFNRKTGLPWLPKRFTSALNPPYESTPASCLLPPCIPTNSCPRKSFLVGNLPPQFRISSIHVSLVWKIPMNGKHTRARPESMKTGAIYKFRRLAIRVNRVQMDDDFIARLIGIWMAEVVRVLIDPRE